MEAIVLTVSALVGVIAGAAQFYGTKGPISSWKRWGRFAGLMVLAFALIFMISEVQKAGIVERIYWIMGAVLMLAGYLGTSYFLVLRHKNANNA